MQYVSAVNLTTNSPDLSFTSPTKPAQVHVTIGLSRRALQAALLWISAELASPIIQYIQIHKHTLVPPRLSFLDHKNNVK